MDPTSATADRTTTTIKVRYPRVAYDVSDMDAIVGAGPARG